jgi:putative flippase GtrA
MPDGEISGQFLRFLVAGGLAASVNVGSRVLYSMCLPYPVAIVLAYLSGMVTAFLIMRTWVFKKQRSPHARQLLWFATVNLFAVLQTLIVSLVLARWVLISLGVEQFRELIAHIAGVLVPTVTSFIGHRYLSFR